MKLGQLASFVDTEFLPEEYRELYQEQMAKLRNAAPPMPWEKVVKVLEDEYRARAPQRDSSSTSSPRRSPPPRSARSTARR